MASSLNTQLTSPHGYDIKKIIFSKPQKNTIPNTKPAISYTRINIGTQNPDGTVGDLIFETQRLFSFGVSENINPETGKVNGYVMPICLWNKDGALPEEKAFTDTFDRVVDRVRRHVLDNKDELEKYDLDENSSEIKKLNPLYWKRVKGKIVEGTGPTLYAKLIQSKKQDKIVSEFYDSKGEDIDPIALTGKYCYVKAAIKIESIFIGQKISLQVKLYEAEVNIIDMGRKRLLGNTRRPEPENKVESVATPPVSAPQDHQIQDDDDDDFSPMEPTPTRSVSPPPQPQKPAAKKVVNRRK